MVPINVVLSLLTVEATPSVSLLLPFDAENEGSNGSLEQYSTYVCLSRLVRRGGGVRGVPPNLSER